MTGIAEWLASIGLGEYAQRFSENAIDLSVVSDLTEQDLKDLGVLLGHRRKMLRAIGELQAPILIPPEPAPKPVPRTDAERRQLTVMFCDLVGSSELSVRLDPEDLRRVIGAYHTCIKEIIGRYQGMIARYMGDGVLAYFGYPQAHEDDAEQATRAGLALVEAVAGLKTDIGTELHVRVGIATGTVIVGDLIGEGASQEQAVIGETPNLAGRLQTVAEPGTVLICKSTRRLTGGHFEYRDLGPVALKGWAEPIQAWHVVRTSGVESRFEAQHKTRLTPLIGREEQIDLLLRRWRTAVEGEGCVVVLTGEPGIGKSHIALALQERIQDEPHIVLRFFCSAHNVNSALFPFIGQLERAAKFERGDTPLEKLSKLETLVARSTGDPEDTAVLANLFALPAGDRYRLQELSPQKRKEKTLAALLAQLNSVAAKQPVFITFEDVHWIDPTSLELLAAAVEQMPRLRALLLMTARPEFTPPWPGYPHMTTIPLTRMGRRDGTALIEQVAGGKSLPKEVTDEILARTDGVPLFIEELTKTVLESQMMQQRDGNYVLERPLPSLGIPTTLHASLMARLDRLAPVREVAQIGAVAGRDFHYELLSAVAGLPKDRLEDALDQLVQSELIFRRGEIPHAVYAFKHALVRDAAYAGLLKTRRGHLHAAIANALEQKFPEVAQISARNPGAPSHGSRAYRQSHRILVAGRQERRLALGQRRGHGACAARHRGDRPLAGRRGQGQGRARSSAGLGAMSHRHARAGCEQGGGDLRPRSRAVRAARRATGIPAGDVLAGDRERRARRAAAGARSHRRIAERRRGTRQSAGIAQRNTRAGDDSHVHGTHRRRPRHARTRS